MNSMNNKYSFYECIYNRNEYVSESYAHMHQQNVFLFGFIFSTVAVAVFMRLIISHQCTNGCGGKKQNAENGNII